MLHDLVYCKYPAIDFRTLTYVVDNLLTCAQPLRSNVVFYSKKFKLRGNQKHIVTLAFFATNTSSWQPCTLLKTNLLHKLLTIIFKLYLPLLDLITGTSLTHCFHCFSPVPLKAYVNQKDVGVITKNLQLLRRLSRIF